MADYQTELSQSGTTLYLKPADGFQRSTVMGNSVANDHQFTGSVLISGSAANEVNIIAGQFEAWVETGTLSDGNATLAVNGSIASVSDAAASLYVGAQPWGDPYSGRISLTGSGGIRVESSDIQISEGTASVSVQSAFGPFGPLVQVTDQSASLLVGYPIQGAAVLTDQLASVFVGSDLLTASLPGTLTATDGTGSLRIGLDSRGQPADPGTISLTDGNSSFSLSNGCGLVYGAPQNPAMPVEPLITFEVHYTGSGSPVHMGTAGSVPFGGGGGEVVFFGTGSTTYGSLYYLNTDGGWEMVNANATGSLGTTGAGNASLLGIAQGLAATGSGMLVRGYQEVYSGAAIPGMVSPAWTGSWATGSAVYIYSGSYSGMMTCTPPEASDSYVRIVGHCTDTPNVIYFNPDSSWIENS